MIPSVPSFPDLRNITLADKELFEAYFSQHPQETSELTFTNFFIWRDCDRSQVTSVNGNICVAAKPENEAPYFFMPLGENSIEGTIKTCLSYIPRFSRVPENFVKAHFEGKTGYKIEVMRSDLDYVYESADLIALKGKKYDGKRNKIKRFFKNNIPIYQKLTEDLVPDCLELLSKWSKSRTGGICFDAPIKEALKNMSALGLEGIVIKINGKVEAFTMGEALNDDMAIIYIEVADPDIDGLPQYVNQQFIKNEWGHFTYINREQDMGDAGLRRAKLSYHPVKLVNKYDVTLID